MRLWPAELPIDKTPLRNHAGITANYAFLKTSKKPLLFIYGEPGLHYLQESQPTNIANIIAGFVNQK